MSSELPRSKEALVFAWGANASASPLFHTGGETGWRIHLRAPEVPSLFLGRQFVSLSIATLLRSRFPALRLKPQLDQPAVWSAWRKKICRNVMTLFSHNPH